jgi:hypothetical protein
MTSGSWKVTVVMSTCGEHGVTAGFGFAPLEPSVPAEPAAIIIASEGTAIVAHLARKS